MGGLIANAIYYDTPNFTFVCCIWLILCFFCLIFYCWENSDVLTTVLYFYMIGMTTISNAYVQKKYSSIQSERHDWLLYVIRFSKTITIIKYLILHFTSFLYHPAFISPYSSNNKSLLKLKVRLTQRANNLVVVLSRLDSKRLEVNGDGLKVRAFLKCRGIVQPLFILVTFGIENRFISPCCRSKSKSTNHVFH